MLLCIFEATVLTTLTLIALYWSYWALHFELAISNRWIMSIFVATDYNDMQHVLDIYFRVWPQYLAPVLY